MSTATTIELEAISREAFGKGASRRLRRIDDRVPAIIYGGTQAPKAISLEHNKVIQVTANEGFYSQILNVNVDGKKQQVVLKDIQRHPYKKKFLHLDFMRVKASDKIVMSIPLHFINEDTCPGIKAGGVANHIMNEVEVKCPAGKLPEFIEVDLGKLEMDSSIHLSELKLPEAAEIVALSQGEDHDAAVVTVHMPKAQKEDESETTEEGSDDTEESKS